MYYQLIDRRRLVHRFSQLGCIEFDRDANRWVWLYASESRTLKFQKPYSSIPKNLHPIVIGSFFLKESEVFLDLRSFDRAIKAIPFFDKHVGPDAARVTHAAVVNRIFNARELFPANLDVFFNSDKMTERHPDESLPEIRSLTETNRVKGKSHRTSTVDQMAKEPLPEIEKFPVNFYEDGISSFLAALRIRQVIALEHWKGNTDYTFYGVFKTMILAL